DPLRAPAAGQRAGAAIRARRDRRPADRRAVGRRAPPPRSGAGVRRAAAARRPRRAHGGARSQLATCGLGGGAPARPRRGCAAPHHSPPGGGRRARAAGRGDRRGKDRLPRLARCAEVRCRLDARPFRRRPRGTGRRGGPGGRSSPTARPRRRRGGRAPRSRRRAASGARGQTGHAGRGAGLAKGDPLRLGLRPAWAMTLGLVRFPPYLVPTLLFPTVFFLFFVSPGPHGPATARMATFAGFAVIGVAFFQFGVGIAADRASPWEAYVRTLPVGPGVRLAARLLSAALFA